MTTDYFRLTLRPDAPAIGRSNAQVLALEAENAKLTAQRLEIVFENDRLRNLMMAAQDQINTLTAERDELQLALATLVVLEGKLRAVLEQIEKTAMGRPVHEVVYIARRALEQA